MNDYCGTDCSARAHTNREEDVGPTARDVAALADVSVSTVSRVLSSPDLVAASTRDRVMAAVAELKYRPNRLAQSLITGRTKNIGLVVPDLQNPYFASLAKGVQGRAWDGGYMAFVADSNEDLALETALVQTLAKQVDGVILCSMRSAAEQIGAFAQQAEVVVLNRQVPGVASISVDNREMVRIAVRHLRALGHDHLAYAGGPRNSWSDAERRAGLAECAEEFPEIEVIDLGHFSPNQVGGAASADLAAASGASAVICFNDLVAIGLIDRLRVRDLHVPGDLNVVGIDNVAVGAMVTPPLTTVGVSQEQLGRTAVDLLLATIDGDRAAPRRTISDFPVELVVRESTGVRQPQTPTTTQTKKVQS